MHFFLMFLGGFFVSEASLGEIFRGGSFRGSTVFRSEDHVLGPCEGV